MFGSFLTRNSKKRSYSSRYRAACHATHSRFSFESVLRITAFFILLNLIFPVSNSYALFGSPSSSSNPDTTASSGPLLGASDFNEICGRGSNTGSTTTSGTSTPSQKNQYCTAAKQAYKSQQGEDIVWKVWAGVAGTCVAACATSYAAPIGAAGSYVCNGAAIGGAAVSAVVTQNLMSSLTVIGGIAMSSMMTQKPAADAANAAAKKEPSKDMGPCIVGATAAYSAYSSYNNMKRHEQSVSQNLQNAQNVSSNSAAVYRAAALAAESADTSTSSTKSSGNSGTTANTSGSSQEGIGAARNGCGPTGLAITQCALAINGNIPPQVSTQDFHDGFQKNTGVDFGNFLNNASHPRQAIAAAAGGSLNSEQMGSLSAALQKMETGMSVSDVGSAYAGGGGGGGSKGASGADDPMNQMMAQMMAQFGPKGEGAEDPQNGLRMVIFANQKKPAAQIPEDKTLSIFDRVTFRYHYATLNMEREGGFR